ncbi:MAG: hypothetical protein JJV93_00580 [Alphaproteobacteria bacterium]|nr:hypothetical protein [Alphaproteobacteria bacterium]MBL0717749.1 hypothetical protein [Alphaproteobacteria bacterium]
MKKTVLLLCLLLCLSSCGVPSDLLKGDANILELRSVQTKVIDGYKESDVLQSIMEVFQDISLVIVEGNTELGMISGNKERLLPSEAKTDKRAKVRVYNRRQCVNLICHTITTYDRTQKYSMTATTISSSEDKVKVRLMILQDKYNDSRKSINGDIIWVDYPEIYQEFFNRLDKSLYRKRGL